MRRFALLNVLLLPICLHAAVVAAAEQEVSESTPRNNNITPLQQHQTVAAQAWGLTDDEWAKFEHLQSGPRHYWSPQLDPLTTLGVEAESDQERQRYAELQVRLEAKRAERELAYQQAYTAAWARLLPGLQPVQGMSSVENTSTSTRYALFVEEQCPACQARALQLVKQGVQLDIYLVGSQGKDDVIRHWARQAGIAAAQVSSGQITLNHDRGRWFGLGASRPLPARYQQVDGQWQRVD
ncbi:TIGR03759 family integrating conjugative element protein [Pseudomonas eucalypticola]|uniref:TIGR03759 family integrating conjugative element protein n=1 Tax=Pseudomonas eucalypticola TaxID=2599595 RepID=A0A7D5D6V7_9PSED|nr:TIGR03759 family integrating conjugative element protein [Pseudomonas eucalypticola]QKZ04196.1 TIGR03759 family integrating conjugative element protein [Pseudomonas eucalypticola]